MNRFLVLILFFYFIVQPAYSIQDRFVNSSLNLEEIETPVPVTEYNYNDTTMIPVYLRITKKISSENNVFEGESIAFLVDSDVIYNDVVKIKAGTLVQAKVETVISSGMNGIPASIILGDFQIPNISQTQIDDSYEIIGQDRSLIVFPLKWALTILPPTGSLTNFIKGGHARLGTNKIIKLYYHPNWI